MVFLGNGTPEGDRQAMLLNQRTIGPDEQTRTEIREFYLSLEAIERSEFRSYLRIRRKFEHGPRFAGLCQRLDVSIARRRENIAVMRGGIKSLPTLAQLLSVVNELDPLN